MARIDSLNNFLTDVANAIRSKTGNEEPIQPENYDTEIESISGGGGSIDIYKVATIAARDALTGVQEGDTCVVTNSYQGPLINDVPFENCEFPSSVTLDTALSSSNSCEWEYNDGATYVFVSAYINSSAAQFQINIYDAATETSKDGMVQYTTSGTTTYTRINMYGDALVGNKLTLPVTPTITSGEITPVMGQFMITDVQTFDGIFVYDGSNWDYAFVDATVNANQLYTGNRAYTNTGFVNGTFVPSVEGGIYKKSSIAEMNAIQNPQEGDICLVYEDASHGVQADETFQIVNFPDTVTLDSAFSDNVFASAGNLMIMIDQYSARFDDYDAGVEVMYQSSDGITYTKETESSAPNPVDFGEQLTISSQDYNIVISKFMIVGSINFSGLYTYKNNSWINLDVGINTATDYIFNGKHAYTNAGNITGTMGNNPSTDFNDANAETLILIRSAYDNMTPIVVTSSDSIPYDIKLIPIKSDGTPLFDMSNMTGGSCFSNRSKLIKVEGINTSHWTSMYYCFDYCKSLRYLPLLDTSNVTDMREVFRGCTSLTTVPQFNTANVTTMAGMFWECSALQNVPVFNTTKCTDISNMFGAGCTSLSNDSINNILKMCTDSIATHAKTLLEVFGSDMSSTYPAATIQSLPNYSAFVNAGWSIGW